MEMLKEVMTKTEPEVNSPTQINADLEESNESQAVAETFKPDEETGPNEPITESEAVVVAEVEPEVLLNADFFDKAEPKKYVTKQKKDKNEDTPTKASSDKKPVENVASA